MSAVEGNISAWIPETDLHRLAVLGKLAEEASELASRASRCIIQGLDGIDPASGRTNLEELGREMADVYACIGQADKRLPGLFVSADREGAKFAGFDQWHQLISDFQP